MRVAVAGVESQRALEEPRGQLGLSRTKGAVRSRGEDADQPPAKPRIRVQAGRLADAPGLLEGRKSLFGAALPGQERATVMKEARSPRREPRIGWTLLRQTSEGSRELLMPPLAHRGDRDGGEHAMARVISRVDPERIDDRFNRGQDVARPASRRGAAGECPG